MNPLGVPPTVPQRSHHTCRCVNLLGCRPGGQNTQGRRLRLFGCNPCDRVLRSSSAGANFGWLIATPEGLQMQSVLSRAISKDGSLFLCGRVDSYVKLSAIICCAHHASLVSRPFRLNKPDMQVVSRHIYLRRRAIGSWIRVGDRTGLHFSLVSLPSRSIDSY